jgi:hypothetical protein
MSTYTRAEVDAEIHKLLKSMQEMFRRFAEGDIAALAERREKGISGSQSYWIDGRIAAYTQADEHLDRLKEGYE